MGEVGGGDAADRRTWRAPYRNFKLLSPISASTNEMIQKRITTWLSV